MPPNYLHAYQRAHRLSRTLIGRLRLHRLSQSAQDIYATIWYRMAFRIAAGNHKETEDLSHWWRREFPGRPLPVA